MDKLKERLVVKGYSQKAGEDYLETFSPVVRKSSVRHLVALAAYTVLDIHQMDVQSASDMANLDDKIFLA